MKSKTSCFNKTIFIKNITHFWPAWMLYLCYTMFTLPVEIWLNITSFRYDDYLPEPERQLSVVYTSLNMEMAPVVTFGFAVLAAILVFSYLCNTRSANMIHSMPVTRRELFLTNYISGALFLLVPQILAFLVGVVVCLVNQITCIQYLFSALLLLMGEGLFAYSTAVFAVMLTGQLIAVPCYFVVGNLFYAGISYLFRKLAGGLCFGVTGNWNPGKTLVLSPLVYLISNDEIQLTMKGNVYTGITFTSPLVIAFYAGVGALLAIGAYGLYKRRQIEVAGDIISIPVLQPLFRWSIALIGSVTLTVFTMSLIQDYPFFPLDITLFSAMFLFGFLFFFFAEMLVQKKFKVFTKRRLSEWGGFAVVSLLLLALIKFDVIGLEKKIPAESEVEAAYIYMDYVMEFQGKEIEQVRDIHQSILDNKEAILSEAEEGSRIWITTLRYYLKDGSMIERTYRLPVDETILTSTDTPSGKIYAMESESENLEKEMFGMVLQKEELSTGKIDLYRENGQEKNVTLSQEQTIRLYEAMQKDIEAGNYNAYYLTVTNAINAQTEEDCYINTISLYGTWPQEIRNTYDRYFDYFQKPNYDKGYEQSVSGYASSISFGDACEYTIQALEEMGVTDDTWKLMTISHYDEIMGW